MLIKNKTKLLLNWRSVLSKITEWNICLKFFHSFYLHVCLFEFCKNKMYLQKDKDIDNKFYKMLYTISLQCNTKYYSCSLKRFKMASIKSCWCLKTFTFTDYFQDTKYSALVKMNNVIFLFLLYLKRLSRFW